MSPEFVLIRKNRCTETCHERSQALPLSVPGNMLLHLDEGKTATMHPVDLLLPLGVGPGENSSGFPSAQLATKRGHGHGRKARGRRPGMLPAACKSIGEEKHLEEEDILYFGFVNGTIINFFNETRP